MFNNILDLLRSDGSIVINKSLANKIGLEETIIYAELISQFKFWEGRGQLVNNDWFFCTIEKLEKHTTIKRTRQSRVINQLVKLGLIETKQMGLPAKRHFRITDKIIEMLFEEKSKVTQNKQPGKINVSEAKNTDKARPDQIAGNEQPMIPENGKPEYPKQVTSNTVLSNNDFEEEDIYIKRVKNNKNYQRLKRVLQEKNIKEKTVSQTIIELVKRNVDNFNIIDVEKQVTHMIDKHENGERIYNFALYFANGLEELSQQSKVLQHEQGEQSIKPNKKRDTSMYFDWLNE